jgi:hypothetical protein
VITRSQFQIHVASAAESAGAEEGVHELEHVIGRAKALGHDYAELERRLARAKAAVRRFREGHGEFRQLAVRPKRATHDEESGAQGAEDEPDQGTGEGRALDGTVSPPDEWNVPTGSSPSGDSGMRDSQANMVGGGGGAGLPESEGEGASASGVAVPAGLAEGELAADGAQDSSAPVMPEAALPSANSTSAPATPVGEGGGPEWNPDMFRREFEGMLGALLEEQDVLRARQEVSEAEYAQSAARQAELEARLREAEARQRFNRDGG